MSKRIIVPQGLINPNETTIIEIPVGVRSEATLIARLSPNSNQRGTNRQNINTASALPTNMDGTNRVPRMTRRPPTTPRQPNASRRNVNTTGENQPHRRVRRVTSTTYIDTESLDDEDPQSRTMEESLGLLNERDLNVTFGSSRSPGRLPNNTTNESLGLLGSGYMDSTRSSDYSGGVCPAYSGNTRTIDPSSLGVLGSGYFDSTRTTDPSSLGVLGSGYMDSTRRTDPSSLGILGSGYMDSTRTTDPRSLRYMNSTRKTDPSSLGLLSSGYMNSTRTTDPSSLGILNSGYMNSTRTTDPSSLGILGSGYMESTRMTDPSSLGVLGSGYMDSTRSTDPSSLGVLGPGYMDSTRSSGNRTNQRTNDESSLGVLGPGYFDSTRSSNARPPRRVVKKTVKRVVTDTPSQSSNQRRSGPVAASTPVNKSSKTCLCGSPDRNISRIDNSRPNSPGPVSSKSSNQTNLNDELQRHLTAIERDEQEQINRDLHNFQEARRRLMSRTATISSGENSKVKFPGRGEKTM